MPSRTTLPTPNEAALQHSHAAQQAIQAEIRAADHWISFAHYMEHALYAPGLGYYSGGTTKFGSAGDFVTAPEISSLFGRALAQQAQQILRLIEQAAILEFGAGSGKLALDLLLELEKQGCLPEKYFILEVSAELRQRQRALFNDQAPHLVSRLHWLEQLPSTFDGLILANEVLDAMPVHLVTWRDNQLFERGVACQNETFTWQERPLLKGTLFEIASKLTLQVNRNGNQNQPYTSEINLAVRPFIHSLADMLRQGAIILIDYGFGNNEYYHPQRNQGTLMCHYRHHAHDDPFYLPGLQDITSHVDFSAVVEAIPHTGLEFLGYTTQAHFLINCGITEILAQTSAEDIHAYLPQANQLQKLVSPAEMGELFKVIAMGKHIDQSLIGFRSGDKSHLL
ncbi:SAM-dependent methyltransferase, MidA family [Nitrosomonas cryotolerans]|uniref:SAM-dependent methyltransferase, MidA family n=1 Tax=Nitrosomonas cryotolerans ATCC 49181 TaxID=1131553 RepID=A0A1N6JGA6_9PROT|nr:SAM-dependent methyltransferase [Nitrosomonas cryotolerans]SFP67149.1 SAM-dependent methyltransferase, MidA family [Nitrosomonas cryotolerans]SIO43189.1 SAM-dependent methyltransferase, MidA family [Nitrosomonas cryotolerans ATCC 49181]